MQFFSPLQNLFVFHLFVRRYLLGLHVLSDQCIFSFNLDEELFERVMQFVWLALVNGILDESEIGLRKLAQVLLHLCLLQLLQLSLSLLSLLLPVLDFLIELALHSEVFRRTDFREIKVEVVDGG